MYPHRHPIGAIAAVLGNVFGRFFVEQGFVFSAGKVEIDVLVGAGEFCIALGVLASREIRHDIMATQHDAALLADHMRIDRAQITAWILCVDRGTAA
jgi:hypothetical protein